MFRSFFCFVIVGCVLLFMIICILRKEVLDIIFIYDIYCVCIFGWYLYFVVVVEKVLVMDFEK